MKPGTVPSTTQQLQPLPLGGNSVRMEAARKCHEASQQRVINAFRPGAGRTWCCTGSSSTAFACALLGMSLSSNAGVEGAP